ncbi:hypothetical protein AAG906_015747 [Vitis piasezkii]|uniref:Transmembrane protein n=2 Tax=Vitis vinifera TaxID=29760 RepID=A0A438EVL9_VITVI|nr:uncharacterized protein LOC104879130 [Vitis vinifera]XP_034684593.1 uncharacterized protein LOC117913665 [Vitis riparia]RVW51755.1 hypothetical protein CK203_066726 [Vitis vinifera]|eukprot:XP_010649047.1 PREDICTED: uncharacterized protein LOC104879130 [Vitis vinifera]
MAMETNLLQIPFLYSKSSSSSSPILSLTKPHLQIFIRSQPHRLRSLTVTPINSSSSSDVPPPVPPPVTPPETVEIRFRRGSKKRRQMQQQDGGVANKAAEASSTTPPPKDWKDMSITEKAIELYVGEKGALFWLNKFAYASIFIVIGAWILFRFVGPALNLYQLDSAPLSPSSLFKGS